MYKCKQCGSESEEPKTCCDQPMEQGEHKEHHEEKCEDCGNIKSGCTCSA